MRAPVAVVLLVTLAGALSGACGDNLPGNVTIVSDPAWEPAIRELAALTPYRGLVVGGPTTDGYQIVVQDDPAIPTEGYQLSIEGELIRVRAHDVLGAQYGVSAALEALGFRFRHPFDAYVPRIPELGTVDTALHQPQVRVRGFQLHTLHPIEGYFATWEPGAGSLDDAKRIIDWTIKNRGNYLQWVPLDNILQEQYFAPWKAHTQEIIAYAHARGVRVGINIQLFGASNLQSAYDLVDEETLPIEPQIAARLVPITQDLRFDQYTLSFGEFFNADPLQFIGSIDEVYRQLRLAAPQAEMHTYIHVGDDQRITYNNEELIYYFLAKYANPAIIPDVHTVMFYNLFEDGGGAYHHDSFLDHRLFLQERMCAGEKGSYSPETAYWVAFDNSVPMFFPLYVHSRLLDLDLLQRPAGPCGTLDQHYLFSSGWEWGYWLNDVAALRATYELQTPEAAIRAELAPDLGPGVADLVSRMMRVQHERVLQARLTGYLVGRDSVIDLGRSLDPPIVSQPDRITFDQLVAGQGRSEIIEMLFQMRRYAESLGDLGHGLGALELPDSRWTRELTDGFEINRLRARFVIATYEATLAHLDGDAAAAADHARTAGALLDQARVVVKRRHADLHDTHGRRLLDKTPNQTFYQFGYLYFADQLCYWERELVQIEGILGSTTAIPPSCFF